MNKRDDYARTMLPSSGGAAPRNGLPNRHLASSHLITTCATFAALAIFVSMGSKVLPSALHIEGASDAGGLAAAFILNIAVILFGWRRSQDLRRALGAHEEAQQLAHRSAYTDHTTGLANRRHLVGVIDEMLDAGVDTGTLMMLDLDHFKKVNDLHGHSVGDELLRYVADTLRDKCPEGSCCARLGGDEFAVLLENSSTDETCIISQSILNDLSAPISLEGCTAHVSASIGVATVAADSGGAEATLRRSDIAMYEAKRLGRNCFVWFDADMERQLHRRSQLENEMRDGIAAGEFVPYYQPQISLANGELKGFEVLARWENPRRGIVEPVEFITIAEASGLIASLSMSVMKQALLEARNWPSDLTIAVNVSPVQFRDPRLAQRIIKLLAETNFPAKRLELEITESSLLEDQDQALATVEGLKNYGISISLDDFGTGYASLTQLKALPFDRIKIDRSFVTALLTDDQSNAIVSTIASLGKSLRLPITAEGVETEGVRERLKDMGCSDAQGWLFGKAVPAEAVRGLLGVRAEANAALLTQIEVERIRVAERRDRLRRPSRTSRSAA